MRDTPQGIVEELRLQAAEDSEHLGEPVSKFVATEAADLIERYADALVRVEAGEEDPQMIARLALDVWSWQAGSQDE
jgi:hypothetical protein